VRASARRGGFTYSMECSKKYNDNNGGSNNNSALQSMPTLLLCWSNFTTCQPDTTKGSQQGVSGVNFFSLSKIL